MLLQKKKTKKVNVSGTWVYRVYNPCPGADPDLELREGGGFALPAFLPSTIFFYPNKGEGG